MAKRAVISATEGHRSFGKLLRRVYNSDEHLVVERDGFPVAVIMSYQEYHEFRRRQARAAFERFSREFGEELAQRGITQEELFAELEKDRRELYKERYGRQTG